MNPGRLGGDCEHGRLLAGAGAIRPARRRSGPSTSPVSLGRWCGPSLAGCPASISPAASRCRGRPARRRARGRQRSWRRTWVRRPFPQTEGELEIPGLTGKVRCCATTAASRRSMPTTPSDLFRAQGYVQRPGPVLRDGPAPAHDRGPALRDGRQGRGSRPTGSSGRWAGGGSPRRAADAGARDPAVPAGVRRRGQRLHHRTGQPSRCRSSTSVLAQQVPDYRVEPWSPADSLAWLKAMAWDLRGNYGDELTRARLAGTSRSSQINELYPPYPYDANQPILSPRTGRPIGAIERMRRSRRRARDPRAGRPERATPRARRRSRCRPPSAVKPSQRGRGGRGRARLCRARRRHRLQLLGGRRASAPAPASRCWPTTPTSASASRASGTRTGCTAARSQRVPVRRVRLLLLGAARRRHRPQPVDRVGLHQPRARRQRLLPRAGHRRHLPARRPRCR